MGWVLYGGFYGVGVIGWALWGGCYGDGLWVRYYELIIMRWV